MEENLHPWLTLVCSELGFSTSKEDEGKSSNVGYHYIRTFLFILPSFGYTSGDGAMTLIHFFHTLGQPKATSKNASSGRGKPLQEKVSLDEASSLDFLLLESEPHEDATPSSFHVGRPGGLLSVTSAPRYVDPL